MLRRLILGTILAIVLAGCSRSDANPQSTTTGKTYSNVELRLTLGTPVTCVPFLPDVGYAQVNSAWLTTYYAEFKADLFAHDITGWEGRFDCNKFATEYASGAQMRFYRQMFHSWNPAQALAVGEVWYVPSWARGAGHAINVAVTERGVLFIEPQTGKEVVLTDAERRSIYYCRF